jgi:hypothetical protein
VDARYRYAALLVAALLAVVAAFLLYKSDWWQDRQARPDFSAYLRAEEPRVTLIDSLRSYDSQQQVAQQLSAAGLRWSVERLHVEGTDDYPPYKLDTFIVPAYQHLGHAGRLRLEFFNDRLWSATFLPAEPESYLRRLERSGVRLRKTAVSVWERQDGNLRIASNIIYATSNVGRTLATDAYASWEDLRLSAQSRQWYDVYGSRHTLAPIKITEPGAAP